MDTQPSSSKSFLIILFSLMSAKLFLHFYTNAFAGYGIFRDELYYLACSQHLALGYVDQPPFSIYVLWFFKLFLGKSIFAIRAVTAISGALTIYFTGLIVRRLGGGSIALLLAGCMVLFAPVYMSFSTFYSMNSLDILLWSMAYYMIIRIIQNNTLKDWIIFGLIVGLGMLNKISMGWLAIGFAVGLLISDQRKQLLTIRPWLAGIIALLVFSPFIIWNFTHDMAHLEFIHNATHYKYNGISRFDFISGQLLQINPVSIIIAIAGMIYLFVNKSLKKYNVLAVIPLVTFIILFINGHSKSEYLSATYTALFGAGAILMERVFRNRRLMWLPMVALFLIVSFGLVAIPLAMPFLPEERYIAYAEKLGMKQQSVEGKELSKLPQFFADMHGWEEMAATVAKVYHALPDSEKAETVIFAYNYGEAGAMDYYRDKYDLPPVVCLHNNYWFWSEDEVRRPIKTMIINGGKIQDHKSSLEFVEQVTTYSCQYIMPYENNRPIFVAKNFTVPLEKIWATEKHYQ